jgi:hypothetical protein
VEPPCPVVAGELEHDAASAAGARNEATQSGRRRRSVLSSMSTSPSVVALESKLQQSPDTRIPKYLRALGAKARPASRGHALGRTGSSSIHLASSSRSPPC